MQSVIEICDNCKSINKTHEYQDQHYGKFFRVKNFSFKNSTKDRSVHRCTVCSSLNLGVDKKSKV